MRLLYFSVFSYRNTPLNVYEKLRTLVRCIKDEKQLEEFDKHDHEIMSELNNIINDNNKHLFNDFLIMCIFVEGSNDIYSNQNPVWPTLLKVIKSICSDDLYENIYYFSALLIFYNNFNVSYFLPNDTYLYMERDENWEYIFNELLKDNPVLRKILKKFSNDLDAMNDTYCKDNKPMFKSLSTVLCMITSYCILTKDYNSYDLMFNKLIEDHEQIHAKLELNNIKEVVNTNRFEGKHPNIGSYIKLILDLVKPNVKQKVIR